LLLFAVQRTIRIEIEELVHGHVLTLQRSCPSQNREHRFSAHFASAADARHRLPANVAFGFQLGGSKAFLVEPFLQPARMRARRASPPLSADCQLRTLMCAEILTYDDMSVKSDILHPETTRISSVNMSPASGLRSIGATISAARNARGLTQQRLAKEARVSRAQLAALEQGHNVSVAFLLKVAHFLELRTIPLDGTVELSAGNGPGLSLFDAMQALDLLGAVGDYIRDVVTAAALPLTARRELSDTPAFTDFLAKHLGNDEGLDRLTNAILRMSDDSVPNVALPAATEIPSRRSIRTRSEE